MTARTDAPAALLVTEGSDHYAIEPVELPIAGRMQQYRVAWSKRPLNDGKPFFLDDLSSAAARRYILGNYSLPDLPTLLSSLDATYRITREGVPCDNPALAARIDDHLRAAIAREQRTATIVIGGPTLRFIHTSLSPMTAACEVPATHRDSLDDRVYGVDHDRARQLLTFSSVFENGSGTVTRSREPPLLSHVDHLESGHRYCVTVRLCSSPAHCVVDLSDLPQIARYALGTRLTLL